MTRYVIDAQVAIHLARNEVAIRGHQLVAPASLRSQVLSLLYQAVRRGEISKKDADRCLKYLLGLRIRLLQDRVSQSVAWTIADELGWADTRDAEYVAVTKLQADALVTLDPKLARAAQRVVRVAPIKELY